MNGYATQTIGGLEPTRVLVVDDDVPLANALQRVLSHMGLDVEIAADGESALRRIEERFFNVMVLDLRMGGMDGLAVLREARRSTNAPATILHSAFLDVPTTVTAMREGVSDVLEKPVAAKVLGDRILELARKRPGGAKVIPLRGGERDGGSAAVEDLLGESGAIRSVRAQVSRIAPFRDVPVLVQGPTGTGKELVARAIHELCAPGQPFVTLNCAAVPDQLFESELFGHEAGSFTSARGSRMGLLEEAGDGTLFLDEVGEMPVTLQPKLLRVLETREFRRVGSNRVRRFSARIVSATNRPLSDHTDAFRTDLYFRLAGYTIATPPLSDRLEDVPLLAERFLQRFSDRYCESALSLASDALEVLLQHDWLGNVRELRSVVENAAIMTQGARVSAADIETALMKRRPEPTLADGTPSEARPSGVRGVDRVGVDGHTSLPDLERALILEAYEASGQNLSRAARSLGIPRSTLRDRLRKFGIR